MSESPRPRKLFSLFRKYIPLILTLIGGIAVSVTGFFFLYSAERARLRADFESMAMDRAQAIQAGISEDTIEIGLFSAYFGAANELAENRLDTLSTEFDRLYGGISVKEMDNIAIFLALRVPYQDRASYEDRAKRQLKVKPDYGIVDLENGEKVPAGKRDVYYPVTAVEPNQERTRLLGLDLLALPDLKSAIDTAIQSGKRTATGIVGFPALQGESPVVWLVRPLYRNDPGTVKTDPIGLAVYAFRIDLLVEGSIKDMSPAGIDFELRDVSAAPNENLLYASRLSKPGEFRTPSPIQPWFYPIDAGRRMWSFQAYATPVFIAKHRTYQSWMLLIGGLVLTLFAGAAVSGRTRRTARIESLVAERTEDLSREIAIHRRLEQELQESQVKLTGRVDELDRRGREIELLNEVSDLLEVCLSLEEALPIISTYVPKLLPGAAGALYLRDASKGVFNEAAHWGDDPPDASAFTTEECWALRRGRTHSVAEASGALACIHASASWAPGYICVPLAGMGETIGLFHVVRLHQESYSFAVSVAEHSGLALSNLKLRSDLKKLSIHDPLTGLYNRRYMEEAFELELRRADRKNTPVGIIMLDIDHFKSFNDLFGHATGDELLSSLGAMLLGRLRGGDIACRFGGEEFVLILPDASLVSTTERAEELRKKVKELDIRFQNQSVGQVSISLGVAVHPANGRTRDEVLGAADAALYRAKNEGRDRVVTAG